MPRGGALEYAALMRPHFGFRRRRADRPGRRPPEGSGSYEEGPVFWEVCVAAAEIVRRPGHRDGPGAPHRHLADVGRAINPGFVERQDEGATLQGIGTGLFEEVLFEGGVLTTDSLLDYRVPTTRDVPEEMTCMIVENGDGPGPFGAKGCGEGALAPVAGAVANALADAGVPMTTLPLTPERVWRRMRSSNSEREVYVAEFKRAAMIGTGTMGPGMGAVLARIGIPTAMYDVSAEALERAKAGVARPRASSTGSRRPRARGGW